METREITYDRTYCFGEFQLCTRARELTHLDEAEHFDISIERDALHRGSPVMVEPKALDLLIYLIENRDRVVPKSELRDVLWDTRPLSETVLSHCVMKARQALEDDGRRQAYIRTVRGHGYRFVAATATMPPQDYPGDQPMPVTASADTESHASSPLHRSAEPGPSRGITPPVEPYQAAERRSIAESASSTHQHRMPFRFREMLYAALFLGLFFALGLLTSEVLHSWTG